MNHFIKVLLILLINLYAFYPLAPSQTHENLVYAQKPEPPYAKWGQLAMKKTKAKYPDANIIDYLHIGRIENDSLVTEKFKLWLRQNNKEFGVYIDITFDPKTDEVKRINYKKTYN